MTPARSGDFARAQDIFDAYLPLARYEQQQGPIGLAVRKYVLMRRGILTFDAQRKPAVALSSRARAEIDYLVARIARTDKRAVMSK